jgi:hypothetical protein
VACGQRARKRERYAPAERRVLKSADVTYVTTF